MEWLIPAVIGAAAALISSIITAVLVRRSNKESTGVALFEVATQGLKALIDSAEARIKALEDEVSQLKAERIENKIKIEEYETKVDTLSDEVGTLKQLNTSLRRYIAKLVRSWPQGISLPEPDEPVTWEN